MGEGETALVELLEVFREHKARGDSREAFLRAASTIEGIYVPGFYEAVYDETGFVELKPLNPAAPAKIIRRFEPDLDEIIYPTEPLLPLMEVVHDRAVLELFRGCSRGCRFARRAILTAQCVNVLSTLTNIRKTDSTGADELVCCPSRVGL